jgi:hypothetical protein
MLILNLIQKNWIRPATDRTGLRINSKSLIQQQLILIQAFKS